MNPVKELMVMVLLMYSYIGTLDWLILGYKFPEPMAQVIMSLSYLGGVISFWGYCKECKNEHK